MSNIYEREIYGYEKDHTRECVQANKEALLNHGTVSVKRRPLLARYVKAITTAR